MTNLSVIDYMHRYLEKFTGTYRVLPFYDIEKSDFPRDSDGSIDSTFDDLYIPCKKGYITHTYKDFDLLAVCFYDKRVDVSKKVFEEIKTKYPKLDVKFESSGNDSFIYFKSSDIKKVATIVKPKTSGAKIKWNDNRNLPKIDYDIPKEDSDKLSKLIKDFDKFTKMHFMKSCNSEFLDSISNKRFDAKEEAKRSRLSSKEYIHSIGMWDKYIKFVEKKIS